MRTGGAVRAGAGGTRGRWGVASRQAGAAGDRGARRCSCPSSRSRLLGEADEVPQQLLAVLGADRLGMELHTPDWPGAVPQSHRHAVIGARDHRQDVGNRARHQRVVADGRERRRDPGEQVVTVVHHQRRAAMPRLGSGRHGPSEHITDSLVPQAHAEERHLSRLDHLPADAEVGRTFRPPGSRRDHHAVEIFEIRFAPAGVVVGYHDRRHAGHSGQVLDKVVGERVVVVDDEHPDVAAGQLRAASRHGGACGRRNEPRLGGGADGGGTTGPMSPSGASSRSMISGA